MIYDYAIIGTGVAGLQLALSLVQDPYFNQKQLLLIDKDHKDINDKTWCFWEEGKGKWEDLIAQTWEYGIVKSEDQLTLSFAPYRYKMVRALDFYNYGKKRLASRSNVKWVTEDVVGIEGDDLLQITTDRNRYESLMVFDSRIGEEFYTSTKPMIWQHFKGWVIETPTDVFNDRQFTMMDFSVKWKDSTSFTYILPFSPRQALVEFTLFTPYFIEDIGYEAMLIQYIKEYMGLSKYEVNRVEKGVIPMTSYPFEKHNTANWIRIGTAGGWVKPSSGYSFKNTERYTAQLIDQLKTGQSGIAPRQKKRFRFYDSLLLDILAHQNNLGESIFYSLYKKNSPTSVLKFLDEQTHFFEELQLIATLPKRPFIKALWRYIGNMF